MTSSIELYGGRHDGKQIAVTSVPNVYEVPYIDTGSMVREAEQDPLEIKEERLKYINTGTINEDGCWRFELKEQECH